MNIYFRLISYFAGATRMLNRLGFPFIEKIARLVYSPDRKSKNFFDFIFYTDEHVFFRVNTTTFVGWNIFFMGYYENTLIKIIKRIMKPGCIALDIGAHAGSHTLIMADKVGELGHIFAFEPNSINTKYIVENLDINNFKNVTIIQQALSNFTGNSTLYTPPSDKFLYNCSLEKNWSKELIVETCVKVTQLDIFIEENHIEKVDFIKIDTEGSDWNVILGAKKTIERFRPYIAFEFDKKIYNGDTKKVEELIIFFKNLNYVLYAFHAFNCSYFKELNITNDILNVENILAIPSGSHKNKKFQI